jgi:Ca2+/Na+ antiporter
MSNALLLAAPTVTRVTSSVPGRLTPLTRAGVVVLLTLAAANGLFLYLLPGQAAVHYAWPIVPPASAAFLGAGFLAGTVPTALVVFATERWRSLRTLPWALFVLAVTLLAATLLHADRFRWGYPPTWGWALVYATVPFGVVILWRNQERNPEPVPPAHPALRPVRALSAVLGLLLVAGAALLFAAPVHFGAHWPWDLTALTGRAIAPWYAMIGVILLACARSLRAPHEAPIPYATLLAWSLLLLALPALHPDDIVRNGAPLIAYLAVAGAVLALSIFALARSLPETRHL